METKANGHIWMASEQFFNAAELIFNSNDINSFVYPLLVNYALSCELSLKASEAIVKHSVVSPDGLISAINSESAVRGHDLLKIFNDLSTAVQTEIQKEFSKATQEPLLPLLEKCRDYFIRGRYPYEQIGGSYGLSDVRNLAGGLLKAVRAYGIAQGH